MKKMVKRFLCFALIIVLLISQSIITNAEIWKKELESTVEMFDTDTGELTISGTGIVRSDLGKMDLHIYQNNFPWFGLEVESLVIEEGIERIYSRSFEEYYTNLESVKLPDSMKWIQERAFYGCTSLHEVSIPEGCALDDSVFEGCTSLININLPDGMAYIGKDCFKDTAAWNEESNFTDNIFYIGQTAIAFKESKYDLNNEIVLREDTKTIANALLMNTKIRAVTFPDGLETISEEVCYGCGYLVGAFIPDSVTRIEKDSFLKCKFLTIYCSEGSYAQKYAIENGIPYDTVNNDLSNALTVDEINEIYREMNKTPEPTDLPEPTETSTPEPVETIIPEKILGDVDYDDVVCAEDALLVLKHAAKIVLITDDIIELADVNVDKVIDAKDALEILKIAAKIVE